MHVRSLVAAVALAASAAVSLAACAGGPPPRQEAPRDGHVRHVRIRPRPEDAAALEALLARCVEEARGARLSEEHRWLCYRERPGRLWLVWFASGADEFTIGRTDDGLADLVHHVGGRSDAGEELERTLAAVSYRVHWDVVLREEEEWSTDEEMSPATHPMARLILRTPYADDRAAFERALAAQTASLRALDYPHPVEGFSRVTPIAPAAPASTGDDAAPTAYRAVFSTDAATLAASTSGFLREAPPEARTSHGELERTLMRSVARLEEYDAVFAPELSYRAE